MSRDRRQHISIGLAIVVAGIIGVIVFNILGHQDDDIGCEVAAGGTVAIAEGVLHGQDQKTILAALGTGVAGETVCKEAVKKLVDEPEDQVRLKVETSAGEETAVETSGDEMREAAPEPEYATSISRELECAGFFGESEFLYGLCAEGVLEP